MLEVKDVESGHIYTWGEKIKVGSQITFLYANGSKDLMDGLYLVPAYKVNGAGQNGTWTGACLPKMSVEPEMRVWNHLNSTDPKVPPLFAYDPEPFSNEALKYWGYLPDITGNGNHLKLENFDYSGFSGKDGYVVNWNNITVTIPNHTRTSNSIKITRVAGDQVWAIRLANTASGLTDEVSLYLETDTQLVDGNISVLYTTGGTTIVDRVYLKNGLNLIPIYSGSATFDQIWISITIEGTFTISEVGKYPGALCFDGTSDFATVPTLSEGGKWLGLKMRWTKEEGVVYDQRKEGTGSRFALYTGENSDVSMTNLPAYQNRNAGGETWIDGVENTYLYSEDLKDRTHQTIMYNSGATSENTTTPMFGKSLATGSYYSDFKMWRTILFPDSPGNTELLTRIYEWLGYGEGYVELPDYYWDAAGKSNSDLSDIPMVDLSGWTVNDQSGTASEISKTSTLIEALGVTISGRPLTATTSLGAGETLKCILRITATTYTTSKKLVFIVGSTETKTLQFDTDNIIEYTNTGASSVTVGIKVDYVQGDLKIRTMDFLGRDKIAEQVRLQNSLPQSGYSLDLNNFSFSKMSGYGGYEFSSFDSTTDWVLQSSTTSLSVDRNGYSATITKLDDSTNYWHFRNTIIKTLSSDISIKIKGDKSFTLVWELKYRIEGASVDSTKPIISPTIPADTEQTITLPYVTQEELTELGAISSYYNIYFMTVGEVIGDKLTITLLPLYPGGLCLDGVDDNLTNTSIPVFTDYTVIVKRKYLGDQPDYIPFCYKGDKVYSGGVGNAFLAEYSTTGSGNYGTYSFGRLTSIHLESGDVFYQTKSSYNGTTINVGSGEDNLGFIVGRANSAHLKGVFYRIALYNRTIDNYSIKMMKNLFENSDPTLPIDVVKNPVFDELDDNPADPSDFQGFLTTYPKQMIDTSRITMTATEDVITVTKLVNTNSFFLERHPNDLLVNSYSISVTGLDESNLRLIHRNIKDETGASNDFYMTTDGVYEIPATVASSESYNIGYRLLDASSWGNVNLESCNVRIEWLK